jgi:hypothetical protein
MLTQALYFLDSCYIISYETRIKHSKESRIDFLEFIFDLLTTKQANYICMIYNNRIDY